MDDVRKLSEMYASIAIGIVLGATFGWLALLNFVVIAMILRQMAKKWW